MLKVLALLSQLPPDKAQLLRQALESGAAGWADSATSGQLVEFLKRSEAVPVKLSLEATVSNWLAPFVVSDRGNIAAGTVLRASLAPWWKLALEQIPRLRKLAAAHDDPQLEGGAAEVLAEDARRLLVLGTPGLTLVGAPATVKADLPQITGILAGGEPLRKALAGLGLSGPVEGGPEFLCDEVMLAKVSAIFAAMAEERAYDPVLLVHAMLNRIDKPWPVLPLITTLLGRLEVALDLTELAPLVDRILETWMAIGASAIARLRQLSRRVDLAEIIAVTDELEDYFPAGNAITDWIRIERLSNWGRNFLASRKAVADAAADRLDDLANIVGDFIEGWKLPEPPTAPMPPLVIAAATLLGKLRGHATRAGFGLAFATIDRQLLSMVQRQPSDLSTDAAFQRWTADRRRLKELLVL